MKLYFAVAGRFVRFWASGGAKFPKMGDTLPRTHVNHREKIDAASFILAGEICNRTNKKRTVTDMSTPCLSTCVDKKSSATAGRPTEVHVELYSGSKCSGLPFNTMFVRSTASRSLQSCLNSGADSKPRQPIISQSNIPSLRCSIHV